MDGRRSTEGSVFEGDNAHVGFLERNKRQILSLVFAVDNSDVEAFFLYGLDNGRIGKVKKRYSAICPFFKARDGTNNRAVYIKEEIIERKRGESNGDKWFFAIVVIERMGIGNERVDRA